MHKHNSRSQGFTIVELLIVIVVIAILAAISVVAYTNIQNRAHDAAVASDLAALKKKIELNRVDTGVFPTGNSAVASGLENLGFKMTRGAYATAPTTANNFVYGRNAARDQYCVTALSKSGDVYYISHDNSPTKYEGSRPWDGDDVARMCYIVSTSIGWPSAGYASLDTTNGPYRNWVGGN